MIRSMHKRLGVKKRRLQYNNQIRTRAKNINRHFTEEGIQMANKHVKRYSSPVAIREKQIKTIMIYHYVPIRMAKIKKLGSLCIASGNIKWYSHSGKGYGCFLKTKYMLIVRPRNYSSGCLCQRNQNFCLHKNLYMNVCGTFISS